MSRAATVFLIWASLLTSSARAGNEDELPVGNRAAMTGGAVRATVRDGSATFYNPAGLGSIERSLVDVSGSAYSVRNYRVGDFIGVEGGAGKDASVTEFLATPTQVAYSRQLGGGVVLGLGYFLPRSSNLLLRERLVVRAVDGTSTWELDSHQERTDYVLAAAVGVRASPTLRWGLGVVTTTQDFSEAASIFAAVTRNDMTEKVQDLSALTTGIEISAELVAGVQVDVSRELTLAATARSPGARLVDTGEESMSTSTTLLEPGLMPQLSASSDATPASGFTLAWMHRGRYGVGLGWRLAGGTLSAEADLQPGLTRADAVSRVLTWNARAGYTHPLVEGVVLGFGAFTDRATSVLDRTKLGSLHIDFYGATLGIELTDQHMLASGEPAESLAFSSTFALRYAYGHGETRVLHVTSEAGATELFEPADGTVTVHELGLHIGSALHF